LEGKAYTILLRQWPGDTEEEKIETAIAALRNLWKLEGTVWNPIDTTLLIHFRKHFR
jgi:hypothetical protein